MEQSSHHLHPEGKRLPQQQPIQWNCPAKYGREDILHGMKCMTSYLLANSYIDISCQKAHGSEFPGYVEHSAMLYSQAQQIRPLHNLVWSCKCLWVCSPLAHHFLFQIVPYTIQSLVANYFNNIPFHSSIQDHPRSPIPVRLSTPNLMQHALQAPEKAWGAANIGPDENKTSQIQQILLLERSQECQHLLLSRWQEIPLLVDQPVRNLGRLYMAVLSDKHMAASVASKLLDDLSKINQSFLPVNSMSGATSSHYISVWCGPWSCMTSPQQQLRSWT